MSKPVKLALVGIGKIARDQHIPSIAGDDRFELAAAVSRNGRVDDVENYGDFDVFLRDCPDVQAVSLCTPPEVRFDMARKAIAAGRDVLLEKPPATTLGEAKALADAAARAGVVLFATWHSRFALGVVPARAWLAKREIRSIVITWKEDVRRWHPGQAWIWEAGGFGVFDPGINALSILTALVDEEIIVDRSRLAFPANRKQPIAASLVMRTASSVPITCELDWRQEGPQTWDIEIETDLGKLTLSKGGSELYISEQLEESGPDREYAGIYDRFAELIQSRQSDADFRPLQLVADAFLCGERQEVEPFHD